ncbi:hypothetical protein D3261_02965 [Halococcus sp. IIIV-5B]|nr:hypothetical protein D3261_02965 [Halococcus sp. IIIV-5B]
MRGISTLRLVRYLETLETVEYRRKQLRLPASDKTLLVHLIQPRTNRRLSERQLHGDFVCCEYWFAGEIKHLEHVSIGDFLTRSLSFAAVLIAHTFYFLYM